MPDRTTSPDASERRRYPRFQGFNLMVNIGAKLVHVAGISATGMKLEKGFKLSSDLMRFTLYPCDRGKVDINHGIGGTCRLVREEDGFVALRFEPASYKLVKFVAECTGAAPDQDP
jgi:hypothetical protein